MGRGGLARSRRQWRLWRRRLGILLCRGKIIEFFFKIINPNEKKKSSDFKTRYQKKKKKKKTEPFDSPDGVSIQRTSLQNPKPKAATSLHETPAIRKHLHATNLQHGPVLALRGRTRRRCARRHDHSESRRRRFETSPKHEPVPRFVKMQVGRNAGETELTDKYGGVKTGLAFLGFYCLRTSCI
jgi:hypothetical protein